MHASRSRAKIALLPDLCFSGDLPTRLDDGQAQARTRALMRIARGKARPASRAQIGEVARWQGVSLKALHNLEERGITESERGLNGVRFYSPDQQVRIEAALALRELGGSAQDIREFLDLLPQGRLQAIAYLSEFLRRRLTAVEARAQILNEALALVEADRVI